MLGSGDNAFDDETKQPILKCTSCGKILRSPYIKNGNKLSYIKNEKTGDIYCDKWCMDVDITNLTTVKSSRVLDSAANHRARYFP